MTELRADAQRNRDRLLVAAAECFAEQGVDVTVDEIARRAGVGHGTVFRRFPTKDALLEAVVCERARGLAAAADEAAESADVWAGFEEFVREASAVYGRDRALLEGLDRCVEAEDVLDLVPAASRHPQIVLDGLRA